MTRGLYRSLPLVALVAFAFASPARAHTLWLKTAAEGGKPVALLFFGESATDEAYKLPKSLAEAKIWYRTPGSERNELKAEKIETDDRVALAAPLADGKLKDGDTFVLETANQYGVYGNWLLTYYTKHIECDGNDRLAASGPSTDLKFDIVPSAKDKGVELTVLWDGKPKADVHVTVTMGDDKSQEFKTDDAGKVTVDKLDGDGLVAVVANFEDPSVQGELNGKKYTTGAQYATLTFPWRCPCHGDAESPQAATLSLPEGLTSFGAVVSDGWLYVYGGHTGKEHDHSAANQSQHFRRTRLGGDGKWEDLKMETPVQGTALVAHGGKVYRVGGMNSHNATTDDKEDSFSIAEFSVFDPQSGKWTALAPLPDARSSHNAAVVGDKLYVVGGWTLSGPRSGKWLDHSLVYDFKNPSAGWQKLPEQSFQRRALAAGEWHGKLVAIGGMDDSQGISQEVDLFDPASGEWSRGPELPGDGMAGFGVSAWNLDGALYVCGSEGGVYRLSDDGSKWEEAARLAKPRFFHQLVPSGDGALLVIGGAATTEEGHLAGSERIEVRGGAANHAPTPAESRAARSSDEGHGSSAAGGQ